MKYDHTFEEGMRAEGFGVRCMWQMNGPKNTMIQNMECLAVYGDDVPPRIFIVQTLRGGGWNVFAEPSSTNKVDDTINAAKALMKG